MFLLGKQHLSDKSRTSQQVTKKTSLEKKRLFAGETTFFR